MVIFFGYQDPEDNGLWAVNRARDRQNGRAQVAVLRQRAAHSPGPPPYKALLWREDHSWLVGFPKSAWPMPAMHRATDFAARF